jgi:zinc protease
LAPLPGALTVDARLVFPIGDTGDQTSRQRSRLAARMLMDDYAPQYERYNVERIDWVFGLGTLLDENVSDRSTTFTAEGGALFADWHVWRLFWRLESGVYPDRGVEPMKGKDRAEFEELIRQADKRMRHDRVLSERLFGAGHFWLDRFDLDARATHDELQAFRRQHYTPSGATLIVSGGFERDEMRTHVGELFASWAARPAPAAPADPPITDPTGPVWIALPDRDEPQVRATVAIGGLPADGDRAARDVLVEMLVDRVRAVREQQGASYGVHVGVQRRGTRAALLIEGNLDPERAGRALTTMLAAASALERGGPELSADFVRARRAVLARALADGGSPGELADELEDAVRRHLSLDAAARRAEDIAKVTLGDVTRIAARDLATSRRIVVVSGPSESARAALIAAGVAPDQIVIERAAPAPKR